MALVATNENKPSTPRTMLEPNNYMGRIVQVVDMGVQPQRAWKGEAKPPVHKIMVTYELGTEFLKDKEGNDDLEKPRWVSESFPLYGLGSELAKSTKRYLALDPSKQHGGDWAKLVGTPCLVQVTKYTKGDGGEANGVGSISQPINGIPVPELVNAGKFFDMDEPDMEMFEKMPDWLKGALTTECLSFDGSGLQRALTGGTAPAPAPEPAAEEAPWDEDMPV